MSKLTHVVNLSAGDWSHDGHKQTDTYTYLCNYNQSHIFCILNPFLLNFKSFKDAESNVMEQSDIDYLQNTLGINLLDDVIYNNYHNVPINEYEWDIVDYFSLIEAVIKKLDPTVQIEQTDFEAIQIDGYGLYTF